MSIINKKYYTMKYILAISGGVDSMVLFDCFLKNYPKSSIIVAHFNHKLRPSADDDEKFVEQKCREVDVRFEVGRLKMNPNESISEERARTERYKFLFSVRDKIYSESSDKVQIITAHHLDDLTETVLVNLIRGTGWRGLSPFSSTVFRPFIQSGDVLMPESKADVLIYAARNKISYRQDPTNFEDTYLRNRIRKNFSTMDPQEHFELNQKIKKLYIRQEEIRKEIYLIFDEFLKIQRFFDNRIVRREWFLNLDMIISLELLRHILELENISLTRPQLTNFLSAILDYAPEKKFNLPGDRLITLHKTYFKLS